MASNAEVDRACEAVANASDLRGPLGCGHRADMLDGIATDLGARGDELLRVTSEETALTIDELKPEFARMTGTLRMFAAVVREGSWVRAAISPALPDPSRSIGPNHDVRRMLVPLGPVAVFGASNFPLAYGVCGGDTASALAAGCPVVFKEHPAHPRTGRLIFETARAAIARLDNERMTTPSALLGYVHHEDPKDHSIAQALVQHPAIKAVGFTGSIAGGMALDKLAHKRKDSIPVFAEMGSVNPVFITPAAMEQRATEIADEIANSVFVRAGQQCTKPGEVFFANSPASHQFTLRLHQRFKGSTPRRLLAPWIEDAYHRRTDEIEATGSASLKAFSDVKSMSDITGASGRWFPQANLWGTTLKNWLATPALREEVFGPSTMWVAMDMWEDAFTVPLGGHLTLSIYFSQDDPPDLERVRRLLARQQDVAGRIIFNGVPTGVRVAPGMVHGGPFPSSNRPDTTAVGPYAMERWCRPHSFQSCPQGLLPPELRDRAVEQ